MESGIYLLLGSNKGNRAENLRKARLKIHEEIGMIMESSKVYQTMAWGKTDQQDFYNQVIRVSAALNPDDLLKALSGIEHQLGRDRNEKWGSRTIDIDILFYRHEVINKKDLIIPHPGIVHRRFTLIPLNEIAPGFLHPLMKKTISELLKDCEDSLGVSLAEEF